MSSLNTLEVSGKRVFLRCDLNVPLKDGVITDDGRIRASLPTIKFLLDGGATIVIGAHLGRPKGEVKPELSLAPVAQRLAQLLGTPVDFAESITGAKVHLLENLRFNNAETSKDDSERSIFARGLAQLADIYVGDGFGAVHRKHASVFDLPALLPHAAGFLVAAEVEVLRKLTQNPERPYGVVLGGAKVSDKIGVISNLLDKVDVLAIGGGMVFTFLAAQGKEIGKSLVEVDLIPTVKDLIARASSLGVALVLPTDIAVATEFSSDAKAKIVNVDNIGKDEIGLDIGPESAQTFSEAIRSCKTLFWNGPMGVFEFSAFAHGTKVVAEALTGVSGISVVGGGDSAAAVRTLGFADTDFGYISTGGGASLEYLEGKELPGLLALGL
ncbi:MAG: phosphoglycerate kinase [Actinobacteria bacterium]|uniref:phosphoglycerate kinase n=1 Tax=freshwater metagenome TaxID=449393 RepID=A0A6J7IIN6_9ZZZZ|nr:phosphoglycerate kinase [Actinomycetota bacterium]MSX24666.1 phosphoglycerate kinase [Actinomycetota bacterium]MSY46525.1 phosphoglycerate kinase [Actinomycetota bacterium]MSY57407.1 phosphoglycerate kinase [Actinomycetota bacterium]MTB00006.1 phosphoglycerate kinase [Actinomycetota bacterium]